MKPIIPHKSSVTKPKQGQCISATTGKNPSKIKKRRRRSRKKIRPATRSGRTSKCHPTPNSEPVPTEQKKPKYCTTYRASNLPRGTVISAPHVTPNFDPDPAADDVVFSKTVGGISGKIRPMIVIQTYTYHVICLPISTFSGKGLTSKPQLIRDDLLEVRGLYAVGNHDTQQTLPDKPLLVDGGFDSTGTPSFVHTTRPCMLDIQSAIKKVGRLTEESLERLTLRYRFAIGKGMKDVRVHSGMMEDIRSVESKVRGDAADAFDYAKALRGGHITKGQCFASQTVRPLDLGNLFSALTDTCA